MIRFGLRIFIYFFSIYGMYAQSPSRADNAKMLADHIDKPLTQKYSLELKPTAFTKDSTKIIAPKDSTKADSTKKHKPKKFQFALATGIEQTAFQFDITNLNGTAQKLKNVNANSFTGFMLGLSVIYKLNKRWDLVTEGDFYFRSGEFNTDTLANTFGIDRFKLREFRIPIHIKYTMRQFRFPPNIATGFDFGWKFNSTKQNQIIEFNPFNSYLDIILGIEFKVWRITINPGLYYAIGLSDIIKPGAVFDNALNSIRENRIGINFHVF